MKSNTMTLGAIALVSFVFIFSSCVPKRDLVASQLRTRQLQSDSARMASNIDGLQGNVRSLEERITGLKNDISNLNEQVANLSHTNSTKESQLAKSQQELQQQQQRLQQLQDLLDQQREKSEALRKKMADALSGFSSNELTVTQKNGKVYVSMQENLLFASGSAVVSQKGVDALALLASVLNTNPDIQIDIEGHTDSIPIRGRFQDNWELSTARANSIVRILVGRYQVSPLNLVASGHSQYDPVATNATPEGRAQNRRTDIILSPKLDELYDLINQ